jgi:hypothetical protein
MSRCLSESVPNAMLPSPYMWISRAASCRVFVWWSMASRPDVWVGHDREYYQKDINGTSEVTRSLKAPWKLGGIGQFFSPGVYRSGNRWQQQQAYSGCLSDPAAKSWHIMKARCDIYCCWHRLKLLDSFVSGFDGVRLFRPIHRKEKSAFSYTHARTRARAGCGCSSGVCGCNFLSCVQLHLCNFMVVEVSVCQLPGTGSWHQLYRAARGSPGSCHFSFLIIFHE